jgi:hypothetical protein
VPAPICNSNIRRRERWCIVDAVAHHCHSLAAGFEPFDCRCLIGRQNLCCEFINPESPGNRIRNHLRIAGDHGHSDAKLMQLVDRLGGLGPNLVFHSERADHGAISKDIENSFSFGRPGSRSFIDFGWNRGAHIRD